MKFKVTRITREECYVDLGDVSEDDIEHVPEGTLQFAATQTVRTSSGHEWTKAGVSYEAERAGAEE